MNFNEKLRAVLQEKAGTISAPPELKEKILNQAATSQGGGRMKKKWIVTAVLAATLLIPSGAFAGYHYLADGIYGSKEQAAAIGMSEQKYEELEAKLRSMDQSMKQIFSQEEEARFMSLMKKLGDFNLQAMDAEGVFHLDRLHADQQEAYESLKIELERYFKRLNEAEHSHPETPVAYANFNDFYDSLLDEAEQKLTAQEFGELERLIHELRSYDAKVFDPDESIHMERLTEEDLQNQKRLIEETNVYLKKMGSMIKHTEM